MKETPQFRFTPKKALAARQEAFGLYTLLNGHLPDNAIDVRMKQG